MEMIATVQPAALHAGGDAGSGAGAAGRETVDALLRRARSRHPADHVDRAAGA